MSTIQDTDWMLINRGANSYKVSCSDVKEQLGGDGVNPGDTDMSIPWRDYWGKDAGQNEAFSSGCGLASHPMTNIFNGKTGEENAAIPNWNANASWLYTPNVNGIPLTTFEFAYYHSDNVASDILIWKTASAFIDLHGQTDTSGKHGREPGYHVFNEQLLGPDFQSFYGFRIKPNYAADNKRTRGTKWTYIDYIKINGKLLYDPIPRP